MFQLERLGPYSKLCSHYKKTSLSNVGSFSVLEDFCLNKLSKCSSRKSQAATVPSLSSSWMDLPVNLEYLPDHVLWEIYHRMHLVDLVWHRPADWRQQGFQNEARLHRTELTVGIGVGPQEAARGSMLWHELQNNLNLFPDGWHEMLHGSFAGDYDPFLPDDRQTITDALPNITSLNIMFDCIDPLMNGELNIANMLLLMNHYAPQLVTLRVWANGPKFVPENGTRWYSLICDRLVAGLFQVVRRMTSLKTLWLDLTETETLELGGPVLPNLPQSSVPLQVLFQNAAATFRALREFRYATSTETDFVATAGQFGPMPTLRCIHIAWGPQWYEVWNTLQPDIAHRFREITVRIREINDRVVEPDFMHFFGLFNALTRVKVHLTQGGPRFLALFRSLAQVPRLQELKVELLDGPLFPQDEAHAILVNRPQPLNALQILVIRMNIDAANCDEIAVWPLFGDPHGDQPFERVVVPHLVVFKMWVASMGVCGMCPTDVDCVLRAINHAWFDLHESVVFVQCIVEWHEGPDRDLVVGDELGDDKFTGLFHPEVLR